MPDQKISQMPDSGALDGTERLEIVKSNDTYSTPTGRIAGLALPPIVTEATTSRTALPAHAGNYTRFTAVTAKTYTFDGAQSYVVGTEFHVRNVGANNLTLTPTGGFSFNAPYNGTLVVPPGGTVTVKIVATGNADVMGVTV